MSGIDYIIDTNVVLYILAGNECVKGLIDFNLGVSVITEMEVLGWQGATKSFSEKARGLFRECEIIDMSKFVKEQAIVLRQKYNIKLPDAIIAATSLVMNVPFVSADNDFQKISELDFIQVKLV